MNKQDKLKDGIVKRLEALKKESEFYHKKQLELRDESLRLEGALAAINQLEEDAAESSTDVEEANAENLPV